MGLRSQWWLSAVAVIIISLCADGAYSATCRSISSCTECLATNGCYYYYEPTGYEANRGCDSTPELYTRDFMKQEGFMVFSEHLKMTNMRPEEACHQLHNRVLVNNDLLRSMSSDRVDDFEWPGVLANLYNEATRLSSRNTRALIKEMMLRRPDVPEQAVAEREKHLGNAKFRSWKSPPPYLVSFYAHYTAKFKGLGLSDQSVNAITGYHNMGSLWILPEEETLSLANNPYYRSLIRVMNQLQKGFSHAQEAFGDAPEQYLIPQAYPSSNPEDFYAKIYDAAEASIHITSDRKVCCLSNAVPVEGKYSMEDGKKKREFTFKEMMCRVEFEDFCARPVGPSGCGGEQVILNENPGENVYVCQEGAMSPMSPTRRCLDLYEKIVLGTTLDTVDKLADAVTSCQFALKKESSFLFSAVEQYGYPIQLAYQAGRREHAVQMARAVKIRFDTEGAGSRWGQGAEKCIRGSFKFAKLFSSFPQVEAILAPLVQNLDKVKL